MPAQFELVLDTAAPQVTWGTIAGTVAGELLRVAYTVDEPAVTTAALRLPDGRQVTPTVLADHIEAALPPDTTGGAATLTVHVADDLGNEADVEYTIVLSGAIGFIPTGPGRASHPTWSPPDVPDPPRVILSARSSLASRSVDRVTVVTTTRRVRLSSSTRDMAVAAIRTSQIRAIASSSTRAGNVILTAPVSVGIASDGRVVRRRDGRAAEESLLLLLGVL